MKKPRKLSKLQKANLLTGQLLFRCNCTTELIKLLEELGYPMHAYELKTIFNLGKSLAKDLGQKAIAEAKKDV